MDDTIKRSELYLDDLISRALQRNAFQAVCALLRVSGIEDANWDPFAESRVAFEDFNWLLAEAARVRGSEASRRVALLIYCQAVEMSAGHDLLVNLVNVASNKSYSLIPFKHLGRPKKKGSFETVPPSAKAKFGEIKRVAKACGETEVVPLIDSFFDDDIRNAFSHSDYVFSKDEFRWRGGGMGARRPLAHVDQLIQNAFGFYGALLRLQSGCLMALAKARRFHRWPNYEVLELLSTDKAGVYGFHVHFSDGSKATFTRDESGVRANNLTLRSEGVGFRVGHLDVPEPVYKVNGVPVVDWDALERRGA